MGKIRGVLKKAGPSSKKILFLDRDGVINLSPSKGKYINKNSELIINYSLFSVLSALFLRSFSFVIVSNQRGFALGQTPFIELLKINSHLLEESKKFNFHFDAILYCTHLVSDECDCRKPMPGLLSDYLKLLTSKVSGVYFLGDQKSDIEAGLRCNVTTLHYECYDFNCSCHIRVLNFKELLDLK
jgi:histidinol-phosphate phosphatase family protein